MWIDTAAKTCQRAEVKNKTTIKHNNNNNKKDNNKY